MQQHQITVLNAALNDTLDFSDIGHDLFLPDPGGNATLNIYTLDQGGNQYLVTSIPLSKGRAITYYLDPTKTPYTPWVQWELISGESIAIPYTFYTKRHGDHM